MGDYVRIGNRSFQAEEAKNLSQKQIEEIMTDAERANQKRLENMRKGLGLEPNAPITLDVTPMGVAARNKAIAAEEAKIAAETKSIDEDLGEAAASFVKEAESPAEVKKLIKKKSIKTASNNITT